MESIIRIKMRVPAGTLIFFALCAAGEADRAAAVLKPSGETLPKEFPCTAASPKNTVAAYTITFRISFLFFVAFMIIVQRSAEKKRSEDQ
jgi:hypothetical protein